MGPKNRPEGDAMLRLGMALAAALLLGLAVEARAQALPTNGNGLTFVPVDTTKNLVAPIPVYGAAQSKGTFFDRFYNTVALILPFMTPRQPGIPQTGPRPLLPQPTKPTSGLGSLKIPEVPKLISGSIQ
jgi:hypothetical protein